MILKNLQLENFGSIKNAEMSFQKGFNVLSGNIGQGKSHIIYSIAYLLLNVLKDRRVDNYLNWNSDSFLAKLELEHKSKDFIIEGTYSNGTSNRILTIDNSTIEGTTDVVNELKKYFDPSLCKAAIVSFQGDTDIISATPSVRRENFRKIYDLDFSSHIAKLEFDIENIKEKELADIEKIIVVLENKEYAIKDLLPLPFNEEERQSYVDKISQIQSDIKEREEEIKNFHIIVKEYEDIKMQAEEYEDKLSYLRCEPVAIEHDLEEEKSYLQKYENDTTIEKLQEDLNTRDWENKINFLKIELDDIKDIRIPAIDIKEYTEKYNNLTQKLNDITYKGKHLKEQMDLVSSGKCPTCGRDFDSGDIESIKKEYEETKKQYVLVKKEGEEIKEKIDKYETKIAEQKEVEHSRELITYKLHNEEERIKSEKESLQYKIDSEKKAKEEKIALLKKNIANEEKRLQKIIEDIPEYENLLFACQKKLDAMDISNKPEPVPDNWKVSIEKYSTLIEEYDRVVNTNQIYKEENAKIKEQKIEDQKILLQKKNLRDEIVERINIKERAITIFKKEFPNYIINNTIVDIEQGTNNFLDVAYDGRYHIKINETKNGIGITYGPHDKDVSVSSGGEQDLFNLGLKNGFSKLTGMGVLILDEVDKFMSQSMSRHVFSIISDMIQDEKDEINQVLMVTHKDDVKEMLSLDFSAKIFEIANNEVIE